MANQVVTQQPAQPRTATSIRAEIRATQANLEELTARRADMAGRLAATNRPGERARLNGDIRRIDTDIALAQEQVAGLRSQLRLIETRAGEATTPAAAPTPPPSLPQITPIMPVGSF